MLSWSKFNLLILSALFKFLVVLFIGLIVVTGVYSTVNIVHYLNSSSSSIGNIEQSDFVQEKELGNALFTDNAVESNQMLQYHDDSYVPDKLFVNYISFSEQLSNDSAPAISEISRLSSQCIIISFYIPSQFNNYDLFVEDVFFEKAQTNSSVRYFVVDYFNKSKLSNLENFKIKLVCGDFVCFIETNYNYKFFENNLHSISRTGVVKITPSFEKYI